jgi:hypothetical protein
MGKRHESVEEGREALQRLTVYPQSKHEAGNCTVRRVHEARGRQVGEKCMWLRRNRHTQVCQRCIPVRSRYKCGTACNHVIHQHLLMRQLTKNLKVKQYYPTDDNQAGGFRVKPCKYIDTLS